MLWHFSLHRLVPLPPRPRRRRRGWRQSGRYIRADSTLALIECQGCFTKPRYATRRLRYLRFLSLFSPTTTMQHADPDMEHCTYHFSSTGPPLTFETERSPYTPSIPPVSLTKTPSPTYRVSFRWNTLKTHDDILNHLEADIICFQGDFPHFSRNIRC